jgi:hypothetical protein
MRPPKRVLLGDTRDREGLAGKTGEQNVVLGDAVRLFCILPYVSREGVIVAEVQVVCLLGIGVPFGREHTVAADALEAEPQATDSREQVDETEGRGARGRGAG